MTRRLSVIRLFILDDVLAYLDGPTRLVVRHPLSIA